MVSEGLAETSRLICFALAYKLTFATRNTHHFTELRVTRPDSLQQAQQLFWALHPDFSTAFRDTLRLVARQIRIEWFLLSCATRAILRSHTVSGLTDDLYYSPKTGQFKRGLLSKLMGG